MHKVSVQATLTHYGDVDVVIASDEQHRSFMGVPLEGRNAESGSFLFIEIDRVTVLELARGDVDLYTVMTERPIGLVFQTTPFTPDDPVRPAADADSKPRATPHDRSPRTANRRAMHRKLLRGPAQMTQGSASMAVRTWDLGPDGMCLVSPRPIEPGTRCQVTFDVPVNGGTRTVTVDVKVVYSSYAGPSQFKVGTVFSDLDDGDDDVITAFATL